MDKVLRLPTRGEGVSSEAFQEWHEAGRAVLLHRHVGHLLLAYRRTCWERPSDCHGCDCVAEWEVPDEAAFDASISGMAESATGELFRDDRMDWLEPSTVLFPARVREALAGPGVLTLATAGYRGGKA